MLRSLHSLSSSDHPADRIQPNTSHHYHYRIPTQLTINQLQSLFRYHFSTLFSQYFDLKNLNWRSRNSTCSFIVYRFFFLIFFLFRTYMHVWVTSFVLSAHFWHLRQVGISSLPLWVALFINRSTTSAHMHTHPGTFEIDWSINYFFFFWIEFDWFRCILSKITRSTFHFDCRLIIHHDHAFHILKNVFNPFFSWDFRFWQPKASFFKLPVFSFTLPDCQLPIIVIIRSLSLDIDILSTCYVISR